MDCFSSISTLWHGYTISIFIILTLFGPVSNEWSPPDLELYIRQHGYPVEAHSITTADGYVLTYHRILYGKVQLHTHTPRKPVLLQHGLLQSSADLVLLPFSIGYLLADNGFDVWLANSRGNTFSRKHLSVDPDKNKKFWDFSFHEMGCYDLPAAIDYILGVTNHAQLFYAGFSMGTTMFFVLGATRPDYMAKVEAAVLMAPVAHPWHLPSPIVKIVQKISSLFDPSFLLADLTPEFLPLSQVSISAQETVCDFWPIKKLGICEDFWKLIGGFHHENIDRAPMSTMRQFYPAGTSFKTFDHMRQITEKDFAQYDYGMIKNLMKYGYRTPPVYNLSLVTAPIYIHMAVNDWLSVPVDVQFTAEHLPNIKSISQITDPRFNHMDFFYSSLAKPLAFDRIITLFKDLSKTRNPAKNTKYVNLERIEDQSTENVYQSDISEENYFWI